MLEVNDDTALEKILNTQPKTMNIKIYVLCSVGTIYESSDGRIKIKIEEQKEHIVLYHSK